MADRRKLQSEIDRCIKKVTEGVDTFEDIWQKVHNATNTNQKEKYEADLKKEIKKLQRLRDQIKTWCASSEIKDKRSLTDNRKLIETQMERFKVVERETKTKAYSKEGLGAAQKLDPIQKEKDEITNWLSSSIDTLSVQVDQFESEIEALLIGQKKSKKDRDKQGRSEVLKKRLEKHRYHIKQLETLMRMLDNETVEVDQIKKIKDDIEYYIESSQEDDFLDNEFIYDDLDLEDMIAFRANNVVDSNIALAKSASTTSASKSEANNSSTAASVENDDINAQSNSSSSANESPSPSPGLVNSHSNKATTNSSSEFAFITSNPPPPPPPSIPTLTTTISTAIPSSSNKTVWSNSTATTNRGSSNTSIQTTNSATSTPYAAAAVASVAISSTNDMLNETRPQINNASNSSTHHDASVHHPSTSTVVTLYSAAAAAAASSVTSTASVSNNPWSNTVSGSNSCDSTNHQMLASRQISTSASSQIQLTAQQQLLLQQQQNNHLFNGFKGISMEHQNISSLKSVAQQVVSPASLDEHMDNSMMNALNINIANLNISSNNGGNASNSLNQIVHMNDMSNAGQNATSNSAAMHIEHPNLFVKNNLLIHQQNSQLIQSNPPASSVSPSINLNSVSSVPTNLSNNNYSSNNISNVDQSSMNCSSTVNTSVNTTLVNSTSQSQFNYPVASAKNNIPKSFLYQTHLLESAFQHPIIPLDSHRLKPLTKMSPTITTPIPMSNYPNQNMSQFDKLEFYQRMTPETLFFIFYYMEGTKAQYMAAKTLKNKSWRFHTKFMMWFQRLEEPKVISEDYEQGTYIFFDYERWAQRKKEGFVFEYKYLEDKELN